MKLYNHILHNYSVASPYEGTHKFRNILLKDGVVVVKEQNNFVGLLTLHDLLDKPRNLVIDALNDKPLLHESDDTISSLMFMSQNNYDFLPIMRESQFIGIVSRRQLVDDMLSSRQLAGRDEENINELKKEISLKNKFIAIIGHDVKSLFTQVAGSLELLDQSLFKKQEAKAHAILSLARKSAEQVNAAFDGMILWAKLGTGQLPFQPATLCLNEYIDKIVTQFQLAGNVKNISISNKVNSPLSIYADPNMLSCVLLNLIYNAIKFTPSGGEIWIQASENYTETQIVIVDSGTGMSENQKGILFKGGKSSEGTFNEMGAGLGLVLCKDFMDKHEGKIEVESEQGKGTRVLISFPKEDMRRWDENKMMATDIC